MSNEVCSGLIELIWLEGRTVFKRGSRVHAILSESRKGWRG